MAKSLPSESTDSALSEAAKSGECEEAPEDGRSRPALTGLPIVRMRGERDDALEIGPLRVIYLKGKPASPLKASTRGYSGCVTIEPDHWLVWSVSQGRVTVSDGFTSFTCLRPECLAVVPGGTVWYFDLAPVSACFVLGLRPDWLPGAASASFDLQAKVIEPSHGLSGLFSGVVAALFQMQREEVTPDPLLSKMVLQTLTMCLRAGTVVHRRGVVMRAEPTGSRHLLNQIMRYVNEHLHEADLNPTVVAEAMGVSVSYVHRVFTQAGQGCLGHWIWELRLHACQADLMDPKLRHLSVETLALSRGFRDVAHFYRRFHQLTGTSPGEWRRYGQSMIALSWDPLVLSNGARVNKTQPR
jgi:AraC-like DNA-binding protein